MVRVLIAGCGYLGEALGQHLRQQGHFVCGLRRSSDRLPPQIFPIGADLTRPESLGNWPGPFDVVFYTAGADRRTEEGYRAAYVEGLGNLLQALQRQRPSVRRFFFTSSTAVYGQSRGEWVDEGSPACATHFRGRCLREGEQLLLDSSAVATIVRVGGIYGPGRHRLIELVRRGEARCVQGPPRYLNQVHRDDCVGALAHLMRLSRPHPLYLLVDNEPAERCELLGWVADRLGMPTPSVEPAGSGLSSRGNKRCRSARLIDSGYTLRYPSFREGYPALLFEPLP